ncbi:MAG: dipeptidase [Sediminibacterium sp.]|nr:dipeptidase [Sediminibacterium sp.]
MQIWQDYQIKNKDRFLNELIELLKIPSISAQETHKPAMLQCANSIKELFIKAGVDYAKIYETEGHPVVYAEKMIHPNLPTVLVYGHYDVQPVEPLELWHSNPFDPVIKDGKIFARGACDDKGQMFMHIKAFETMVATNTLHNNIKFIIEGEEEIGSPNLSNFIITNKALLKCDVILISDTSMIGLDNPSIDIGVRGLTYIELELTGPNKDLHSGVYGGAVANPITILSKMIASCHNENNEITIPHFYENVVLISAEEKKLIQTTPFDINNYKKELGINEVWGEKNYSTLERTGTRPTLEINGIWGGYTGEGAKTVLPSKAFAKISCRLVPNQRSEEITIKMIDYFNSIKPNFVDLKITVHHGGEPYITPIDSIEYKAASKAIEKTLHKKPIPVRGGGSIPICALFEKELHVKIVFLGFGLDNDNLHSPNEKYNIENFYKGIETIPYFHEYYTALKKGEN